MGSADFATHSVGGVSAGLGIALAEHMAKAGARRFVPGLTDAPMLFVVGSTHPASQRQKQMLLAATDAVDSRLNLKLLPWLAGPYRERRHVVLTRKARTQ